MKLPTATSRAKALMISVHVSIRSPIPWTAISLLAWPRGLVRKKVEVVNYPDGRFAVQFNGALLGFKVFDKIQTVQQGAIVGNKQLSAVLEQVKAQQAAYPARQQRGHVARQRPPNNLEAPGLPSKGRAPRHG